MTGAYKHTAVVCARDSCEVPSMQRIHHVHFLHFACGSYQCALSCEAAPYRYTQLEPESLPPLWLMSSNSPSDSGTVHSDVKRRWVEGDEQIIEGMAELADIARTGR